MLMSSGQRCKTRVVATREAELRLLDNPASKRLHLDSAAILWHTLSSAIQKQHYMGIQEAFARGALV